MGTLIDSSIFIAVERGKLHLADLASRFADEQVGISAVTASELLHGLHRARTSKQRHKREAFVEGILARIPVVSFDLMVARVHASLWADLVKRGNLVGERDLMIGATAMARNYAVSTCDARSFPRIPGLTVHVLSAHR